MNQADKIKKLKQVDQLKDLVIDVRVEQVQAYQLENAQLRNRVQELERELGIRRKTVLPRSNPQAS